MRSLTLSFKKQIDEINDAIKSALEDAVSKTNLKPLANKAADLIRIRTRVGYGVSKSGSPKEKLKELKGSTKKSRNTKKKRGLLSDETSPSKSNLTETGKLLDSIKASVPSAGVIQVRLTGSHGDDLSNEKLGEYMHEGSANREKRPFMGLTDLQIKQLTDDLRRDLLARVNKALTKKR